MFVTVIRQTTIKLPQKLSIFYPTLRHFGNKNNVKNSMKDKIYDDDEYYNSMSLAHSLYDACNSNSYIEQINPDTILTFTNSELTI
jgi:hypothetical protein